MIDVPQVKDKLQGLKSQKAAAAVAAAELAAHRHGGAERPPSGAPGSGGSKDELWIVDPKTGRPQAVPASQLRERVRLADGGPGDPVVARNQICAPTLLAWAIRPACWGSGCGLHCFTGHTRLLRRIPASGSRHKNCSSVVVPTPETPETGRLGRCGSWTDGFN